MVLPVPGIEFLDDAVIPEPARQYFIFLRYCVAAEGVFAILRLLMGDIAGALSDVICVLFGVFFLRSDDWFRPIYLRLENTTLSGFRVLMPFCFLSGLNGVFNLCVFVQFPILVPYTILTTSLGILEVACAVLGYKIYKIVSNTQLGGGGSWGAGGGGAAGGGVGGGGLFDGGGGPRGQDGPPGGSSAAPRPYITSGLSGRSNEPFQVFQGQGRRLGDSS